MSAQGRGKNSAPSKRTLREAAEEWLAGAEAARKLDEYLARADTAERIEQLEE